MNKHLYNGQFSKNSFMKKQFKLNMIENDEFIDLSEATPELKLKIDDGSMVNIWHKYSNSFEI